MADERLCAVCFQLVPDEEAHLPHEPGCSGEGCRCDFYTHPECCWKCEPNPRAPGHRGLPPLPSWFPRGSAVLAREATKAMAAGSATPPEENDEPVMADEVGWNYMDDDDAE
jgi:hypothetical protein